MTIKIVMSGRTKIQEVENTYNQCNKAVDISEAKTVRYCDSDEVGMF